MKKTVAYVFENRMLKKLVLSKSVDKNILRITGRLIEIKGELYLALESFLADGKAIQKNIPINEAAEKVIQLIPSEFKQMNIITTMGDCEVKAYLIPCTGNPSGATWRRSPRLRRNCSAGGG